MSARSAGERLQRRGRIFRILFWAAAIAAIVLAILFVRCGGGWGLGLGGGKGRGVATGKGDGEGTGKARPAADRAPLRCQVRVDGTGLSLDGKPSSIPAAVTACKATAGADVLVAGDARQGTWDELRAALDAAGIPSLVRGAVTTPPAADAGP
jgi:hypothetical protein